MFGRQGAVLRAIALAATTGAVMGALPGAAHAQTAPTLANEFLAGSGMAFAFNYPTDGSQPAGCDPSGTSTVTFTQSGVASGPYPGPYTETVRFTLGPQSPVGRASGPGLQP